jgi:two-component system nitrate/nitrite response regulator NarL
MATVLGGTVAPMRLILGDDHAIFLDALASVLTQHGYDISSVARSPQEMLTLVGQQVPDACVVDHADLDTIRSAAPGTVVVVLSADPDPEAAERALAAGATGYLHQSRGVEVLVAALGRMLQGERVVDLPGEPGRRPRAATDADNLAGALTQRESECLALLVAGLDTSAMMGELGVSRTTVRSHLQAVLSKLCVHSRLEAASFAVQHNLVDAPQVQPAARQAGLRAAS